MIVLLGVGSTDVFSPIWKLHEINPKSQVAKECKTASNRTAAFDLWAAERCRQLRLLLSLAASLIFAKMITAAEICCCQRIRAGFVHPWGPPLVLMSLLAARIFCLHLIAGKLTCCVAISWNTKCQTQVKHGKSDRATLENCLSHNSWNLFSHLCYE